MAVYVARMKKLIPLFFLFIFTVTQAQTVLYLPVIFKNPPPPPKQGVTVFGPYANTGCLDVAALSANWWYNWWTQPNSECNIGFVPMLYMSTDMSNIWLRHDLLTYGATNGYILGYNEPNLAWQGNTTPAAGAITWRQLEELVKGTDIKLVSPAPSQHGPGELDTYGYTWLLAMVREYELRYGVKPRFDAIAWHYYGSANQTKAYLIARHNEFAQLYPGVPIWITEFNPCLTNSQSYSSYMADMLPWLESQSWIERYSWFINRPTSDFPETYSPCTLMNEAGQLTPAGVMYRTY